MLKKPRLESVVVLVTSLATVGLTAAALLIPAPESPAMTAVTSTRAVVSGVPAAAAHSATARLCAGGEVGKPARHAAPAAVPPAGSAPRPLGGSRICTLSLLHRGGKLVRPCRIEPCRGGANDGPAGDGAGGLRHSSR